MSYRSYNAIQDPCLYYTDLCERYWCERFRRLGYNIDMGVAIRQYRAGNNPGYDILARRGNEVLLIEVKSGKTYALSETQKEYMYSFSNFELPEYGLRTRYILCTCDSNDTPLRCYEAKYREDRGEGEIEWRELRLL